MGSTEGEERASGTKGKPEATSRSKDRRQVINELGLTSRQTLGFSSLFVLFSSITLTGLFQLLSVPSNGPEPGVNIASPTKVPPLPIQFTVHFNGDGLSDGISINSEEYRSLDTVITDACEKLLPESGGDHIKASQCLPRNGAKLFTYSGIRVYSFVDIEPLSRTYIVPQGLLFMYPLGKVGDVIIPGTVRPVYPGKPVTLRQLSNSPRVFKVDNFMTEAEMSAIVKYNEDRVAPSRVTTSRKKTIHRTSYTAWDAYSWAAKRMLQRSFDLLGLGFDSALGDSVQVLRYQNKQWYKPHCDWLPESSHKDYDPTVRNGTNRFATVFLYLSNVDEGGETVFPLSTTHEGYNGEYLVKENTFRKPSYISEKDAKWVCNNQSKALRTTPQAGTAILFYSQGPTGKLEIQSLHGGCPVRKGLKWSANVWIWNRPRPATLGVDL